MSRSTLQCPLCLRALSRCKCPLNEPLAAVPGSVLRCISAGCSKEPHAATWVMFPDWMDFPVCDAARLRLLNPPRKYRPGLALTDFAPVKQNVRMSDGL
jgi:hypothetical protein